MFLLMKKENHWFVCEGCGKDILPAEKTSRNHCPNCFLSLHVDDKEPGDRASNCGWRMIPLVYEMSNGQCKIHFTCITCGAQHTNKSALDDDIGELDMRIWFWKQKYAHKLSAHRWSMRRKK